METKQAQFLSDLITKDLDGRWNELTAWFGYYSDILDYPIIVPAGFITDFESTPIFKSYSKRAGVIHDYLCRTDSIPVVTKSIAAKVYLEAMTAKTREYPTGNGWWFKIKMWCWRNFKAFMVKWAWFYFHKYKVNASYEEMKGE